MGRESVVACMPTSLWSLPVGSAAPIENSTPGIHAMPGGAAPDGPRDAEDVDADVDVDAGVGGGLQAASVSPATTSAHPPIDLAPASRRPGCRVVTPMPVLRLGRRVRRIA